MKYMIYIYTYHIYIYMNKWMKYVRKGVREQGRKKDMRLDIQ